MKMGILLALALVFNMTGFGADDHSKEKENGASSGRPSEDKGKKTLSLDEKISACLAERPGKTKKGEEGTAKDAKGQEHSKTAPSANDGQAVFEANCFPCHSASGTPGPISDWKRAAVRAGDDMPPTKKPIPAEELAKLREFLSTKN